MDEKKSQLVIICLVSAVLFMEFLDLSIINTAVPTIARDFAISPLLLKFSVASYYLSLAIFIPISGWCADRFGTKNIFLFSVGLFVIASLLCAHSHTATQLTLFRFLQGVGGAFMNPISRIVILKTFPPKYLLKVQTMVFTPALLGIILGPTLGGVITEYFSWGWIFLINVPIGLIIISFGIKYIKQYIGAKFKPFDWVGFIITACGLLAITFYIEMINHYDIVSKLIVMLSGAIGILLILISVIYCLVKKNAIFDLSLFRINTFNVGVSSGITFFLMNSGIMFMLPLMYQECFGYTPAQSGYLILPIAISSVICRGISKNLIHKFSYNKMLITGSIIITACMVLLGTIRSNSSMPYIVLIEICYGFVLIMTGSCTGALSYINTPKEQVSNATSFDLTFRQFFSSLGVGVASVFITSFALLFQINPFTVEGQKVFHYAFFIFAIFGIITILNAFRLKPVVIEKSI
ncbi:MAG: DHA2 family efflux MFS transporter permease subunit [Neisseriaceae bacterium]